jgi:hypothetical protein
MPSTIEQAKEVILKRGGKASKHQIGRELKISLGYTDLILGELKRRGEIAFSDGSYVLTPAKKEVIQVRKPKAEAKAKKKTAAKKNQPHPLVGAFGINESLALTLEKAGYGTMESLAKVPISKLMDAAKIKLHVAAKLINQARGIRIK